ncbi:MAG: CapA family protein [Pirellulales bacterium]|nr:CapA family protein [Pirellulales bacterium]
MRAQIRNLILLLAIWGNFLTDGPAAEPSAPPDAKTTETVEIIYVGDIMLADLPGKFIATGGDPFTAFAEVFEQADLVVGNLECAVGTTGKPIDKPWTFQAHPRVVPHLAKYFDAVSVANNHTGDYGPDAFLETLDHLRGNVGYFGGGKNLAAARQPLTFEKRGLKIVLLGYNEFKPRSFAATDTQPGCAWGVDEHVLEDIKLARQRDEHALILPYMHWGHEGDAEPSERQTTFSRQMLDAGASAVIGAHPHNTQGWDAHADKPIVYSLGNFVFDGFERPDALVGWVLRLHCDRQGVASWEVLTARIDKNGIPALDKTATGPSWKRGE